jgi:hypothetical protein
MKKDTIRVVVAAIVALAMYHLLVFLVPFERAEIFWISYGFTLIAFALFSAAVYFAYIKHPNAKSKFYGFPILRIAWFYGVAQLVVSLVMMALEYWIPGWVAILLYALGLGAVVIGLISVEEIVDEIQMQDAKL